MARLTTDSVWPESVREARQLASVRDRRQAHDALAVAGEDALAVGQEHGVAVAEPDRLAFLDGESTTPRSRSPPIVITARVGRPANRGAGPLADLRPFAVCPVARFQTIDGWSEWRPCQRITSPFHRPRQRQPRDPALPERARRHALHGSRRSRSTARHPSPPACSSSSSSPPPKPPPLHSACFPSGVTAARPQNRSHVSGPCPSSCPKPSPRSRRPGSPRRARGAKKRRSGADAPLPSPPPRDDASSDPHLKATAHARPSRDRACPCAAGARSPSDPADRAR